LRVLTDIHNEVAGAAHQIASMADEWTDDTDFEEEEHDDD
jgi:hypothetical protein